MPAGLCRYTEQPYPFLASEIFGVAAILVCFFFCEKRHTGLIFPSDTEREKESISNAHSFMLASNRCTAKQFANDVPSQQFPLDR